MKPQILTYRSPEVTAPTAEKFREVETRWQRYIEQQRALEYSERLRNHQV